MPKTSWHAKSKRPSTPYWPTLVVIAWILIMGGILTGGALSTYLYQPPYTPGVTQAADHWLSNVDR